tara:strand:+ start:544 stop:777 length:234 start_codon:yes stop_codon:yes gene_type:complete
MKKPTVYKIEVYIVPAQQLWKKAPATDEEKIVDDVHEALSYIDTISCVTEPTIEEMEVVPKKELDIIRSIHDEAINA